MTRPPGCSPPRPWQRVACSRATTASLRTDLWIRQVGESTCRTSRRRAGERRSKQSWLTSLSGRTTGQLFFRSGSDLIEVEVDTQLDLAFGKPEILFQVALGSGVGPGL